MWYMDTGEENDVVISTRIRLARNIDNIKFGSNENIDSASQVKEIFKKIIDKLESNLKIINLSDIDDITKMTLIENHIISPAFALNEKNVGAVLLNDEQNISIMLNEEDHIRLQILSSGLSIQESYALANNIDDLISQNIKYAYSNKYGYLTSSPTNVGTGLRVSIMVHLPALSSIGSIAKVLEAVNNMGANIRGVYGEGTKSQGNIYQISNKTSLGLSEQDILNNLKIICENIIDQERLARKHLGKNELLLEDRVYRAYGTVINARKVSSQECQELLSDIKLGVDMGIIKEINDKTMAKLNSYVKPANIQKYLGKVLTEYDRDIERAKIIKEVIKNNV